MKIDRYSKVILTIIAIALSIIAAKDLSVFPNAQASDAPINLAQSNADGWVPVGMSEGGSSNYTRYSIIGYNASMPAGQRIKILAEQRFDK